MKNNLQIRGNTGFLLKFKIFANKDAKEEREERMNKETRQQAQGSICWHAMLAGGGMHSMQAKILI